MQNVVLKPELRTPGGETVSIYFNEEWAGDLYLVYREGDTLTGTMQIDTGKVSDDDFEFIEEEVRIYVNHLNSALGVTNSSVVMVHGDISSVIEMEPMDAVDEDEEEDLDDREMILADFEDPDTYDYDGYESNVYSDDEVYHEVPFHLSLVYKKGEHTKYHLLDDDDYTLGVVSVDEIADNIAGRVELWDRLDEDETNDVARMLTREFSRGGSEKLSFTMNYQDEHVGDIHIETRDFLS